LADGRAADVVAGCLGSGAAVVKPEKLPRVTRLVLDLGTPRNFADSAGWPRLLTIADLLADEFGRPHAKARRAALAESLRLVVDRRLEMAAADGESSVGSLRRNVERIRQREVARTRRLHPDIAPEVVDAITRGLVNQILHAPSKRLRDLGDADLERRVATLFA
jgi:glutamyl-tRNA reductase